MAKHLAIIGSPGSGKSIFAAALAREVTKRKKRAIIVSGNSIIPMLPFFCGNTDTDGLESLYEDIITPQSVAKSIKVLKEDANIGVMGGQFGVEPVFITEEKIRSIADVLDRLTDIVIWDGTGDMNHIFDQTALLLSSVQACVLTSDVKGVLYFEEYRVELISQSNLVFLEGLGRPYSPYEKMSVRIGGFFGQLPYGREIERVYLEGKIFSVDKVCNEKYRTSVEKIIDRILMEKEE